jgi:hypothetical protein
VETDAVPMAVPAGARVSPALLMAILGLVVLLAAVSLYASTIRPPSMPANPDIEARWGIRVTQVGVIADGGLIDVRFLVLDADRALELMSDPANLPVIVDARSGLVVRSAAMMGNGHHQLPEGRTSFLLYRNTRGAIKSGSLVALRFGELRLDHVPVP